MAAVDHGEVRMESDSGSLIVAVMVAVFGLVGLFLAAGAADDEMYVFGFSLAVFAVCFDFGLLKRHFDLQDAARAAAREATHV